MLDCKSPCNPRLGRPRGEPQARGEMVGNPEITYGSGLPARFPHPAQLARMPSSRIIPIGRISLNGQGLDANAVGTSRRHPHTKGRPWHTNAVAQHQLPPHAKIASATARSVFTACRTARGSDRCFQKTLTVRGFATRPRGEDGSRARPRGHPSLQCSPRTSSSRILRNGFLLANGPQLASRWSRSSTSSAFRCTKNCSMRPAMQRPAMR